MPPKFIREKHDKNNFEFIWLYDKVKRDYFAYHNKSIRGVLINGKVKIYDKGKYQTKGYYNMKTQKIFVNPTLKGYEKFKWTIHEKIHKFINKKINNKLAKYINLLWDLLDNDINTIPIYLRNFKFETNNNFGGTPTVNTVTKYAYRIKACHSNIDPNQPILCYDAYGELVYTVPPYYANMDYANGILNVPGTEKNTTIESVATATYYVLYSTSDLIIDYDNAKFYVNKSLVKSTANTKVTATYEYLTVITPFADIAKVIDGNFDTQVQTVFYAEPPTGYNYAILDFGSIKTIQALDIVAGYFKPDQYRKFDVSFKMSLQYSLNGTNFYEISDDCHNVEFNGGSSVSFEEDKLGTDFQCRYLKLVLENVDKIDYSSQKITVSDDNRDSLYTAGLISSDTDNGTIIVIRDGIYVVAFTELEAYDNITIKSESKLIPTTYLTTSPNYESGFYESGESGQIWESGGFSINVQNTHGFTSSGNAYIKNSDGTFDVFHYDSITDTSFESCSGLDSEHLIGDMVVQELEGDLTLYDYDQLLPKLKDRVYKLDKTNDSNLYSVS
ncbi:MAG: discoidin domain-containing protein, partial [Candidatus Omnitrophota bacterium]